MRTVAPTIACGAIASILDYQDSYKMFNYERNFARKQQSFVFH